MAPSIFAEDKHASRSERYSYIPTAAVLTELRKEGFQPFMVCQTRVRQDDRRDYTKHLIRLRHGSQINGAEANEIILLNSHDGTSTYLMLILVCHLWRESPYYLAYSHLGHCLGAMVTVSGEPNLRNGEWSSPDRLILPHRSRHQGAPLLTRGARSFTWQVASRGVDPDEGQSRPNHETHHAQELLH